MHTKHSSLLFAFVNLLLCGPFRQAVLVTFAIKQIDARDSKISPELRTYSKFEDELRAIRNRPNSSNNGNRNPIDSAGPDSVNKFLSKESDSGEIESIDGEDEQSTPASVRLELNKKELNKADNKEAVDNQNTLPDSSDEIKPANETRNNSNSNPINQATGNQSDSSGFSDGSGSSSDHHKTVDETTHTSNATNSRPTNDVTSDVTSDQPLSVPTSSSPDPATGTELFERTTTSDHLGGDHLNDHLNDHLSQSTEASGNQTAIPLDQTNSSPLDTSSTTVPTNVPTLSTTAPNFTETTDSDLNLAGNKPSDLSKFTHKPCYTLDELESMNCSSCLRCAVILSAKNKSMHLEQYKVILVFSNETFSILDFLGFETRFRNDFELIIRNKLNISQSTIIYEDPFPIVNLNQTVLSILVANRTFQSSVVSENDLKSSLVNASHLRDLFNESRSEIEKSFRMQLTCLDTGLLKRCAFPLIKVKFAVLFILLQFFVGLVLLTSLLLLIVFCTSRSKSKKQSTKLKAFSETDNEYQFYDFSDRPLANPIRLQYLNRIPESDFGDYQRTTNGLNLADESDIIREEHLSEQLLLKQSEHGGCCGSIGKLTVPNKSSNEKLIFYNPKYERKSPLYGDHFEAHRLHNGHSNLIAHLSSHIAGHLPPPPPQPDQHYGLDNAYDRLDSSGCDLKFLNCNCMKMNRVEESRLPPTNPLLSKNKPPTGRAAASSNKPRLEIVDTKL